MAILPGTRIRDNGIFGNITDNPLTIGATTYNSPDLADLVAVSSNHAIVTLDPLRQFGDPEIVMITAHTAAATVATIQRGMYGTAARAHPVGTLWVHAATQDDFIEVVTSGTRPADQYEGQFIFETDTNKLMGFGGVDWAPRDAGGQLGYAQIVVAQTGISAEVDVAGLSVNITVGTGRRIKITVSGRFDQDGTTGELIGRIREGATETFRWYDKLLSSNIVMTGSSSVILTPSAGAHTYRVTAHKGSGAGTCIFQAFPALPAYILVEDIGAA